MKSPKKSRLVQLLEREVEKSGLSQKEFARQRLDVGQQTFSTWLRGIVPTRAMRSGIKKTLKLTDEQMDELISDAEAKRAGVAHVWAPAEPPNAAIGGPVGFTQTRDVPVYGRVVGGGHGEYEFNGQEIDWVMRPPSLVGVKDAYAVMFDGDSMYPRYRAGHTGWVHPGRTFRAEDGVVVQLRDPNNEQTPHGYVKEFVRWTPTKLILRQYNPEKDLEFSRDEVVSVHPIVLSEG